MYIDKNPYYLSRIFKMHGRCSRCGLKYKIEPSFFFGAMYVSYGLGVAIGLATFLIAFYLVNTGLKAAFIAITVALVVLMPVIARFSRNIWINFFISYDRTAANAKTS